MTAHIRETKKTDQPSPKSQVPSETTVLLSTSLMPWFHLSYPVPQSAHRHLDRFSSRRHPEPYTLTRNPSARKLNMNLEREGDSRDEDPFESTSSRKLSRRIEEISWRRDPPNFLQESISSRTIRSTVQLENPSRREEHHLHEIVDLVGVTFGDRLAVSTRTVTISPGDQSIAAFILRLPCCHSEACESINTSSNPKVNTSSNSNSEGNDGTLTPLRNNRYRP